MANRNMLDRPQFGKLKLCKTIGVEDRISALPDDILSHILTWLTLKEAIATGILSKRWKKLWVSYPNLDFGCINPYKMDSYGCTKSYKKMDTYVQRVNEVLRQYNGPKLHKLRIVYPLLKRFRHIDDWISFAIRNGVSELELNFNYIPFFPGDPNNYYFPAHVFGGEEMVNSKHLHTTSPNVEKHFESLRDLCLRSVNLSDEVFDLILSSCISLERFLLMYTDGLVNAKNTAPHLKLKSLELYFCNDLETLQFLAPNLISFKFQGRQRDTLCLKDAKQLASLRLSAYTNPNTSLIFPRGKNFISQFSSHLPKLEYLVVTAHLFEDLNDFTELCVFSNLKQLVLDVFFIEWTRPGYLVVASIIRAAPFLELLEIILPAVKPPTWWRNEALELASMSPPHQNLKEVKLSGFRGDEYTMEFLAYLVEYAVSLQKIDVTLRDVIKYGDLLGIQRDLDWDADDAENYNCVLQQLRQTLPANTQLLFHDG